MVSGDAEGGSVGHHAHHEAENGGDGGASVDQVPEEQCPSAWRWRHRRAIGARHVPQVIQELNFVKGFLVAVFVTFFATFQITLIVTLLARRGWRARFVTRG